MCGRYELHAHPAAIALAFALDLPPDIVPRYNIAPTQQVPIVRERDGKRQLTLVRWGLVPFFAKDPSIGSRMINARAETVATAPSYRLPFKKSRCLVPASGFYEWKKLDETGKRKQPYHLGMRDESVFAFAGLWTRWKPKEGGEPLDTCVIITTEPNELAATVHNRMPVIIAPEDYARRLDTFAPDATDLLRVLSRRKDGSVSRLDTRQFAE